MFYQPDLFEAAALEKPKLDMAGLVERIVAVSARPRYTLIVLNLLARAADSQGIAGPHIIDNGEAVPVRDWLGRAMIPMAQRSHRRASIRRAALAELLKSADVSSEPAILQERLEEAVSDRLRQSARCNVSRAVSDLVRAGLVLRHYQGYCVDHQNRGAQREAVYTLVPEVRAALA